MDHVAPLVSVVTIFLNAGDFLAESIESVLGQTYPHWELLLVDDGSSDSSSQVARAAGITLYAFRDGSWTRHRVWRKKESKTLQYALAMGDLDGDGLDDIVFPDSDDRRLKLFFQQADGSFVEAAEKDEPALDSPGQCARLVDLDKDGRLDIVLSKTVSSARPDDHGGWDVYLNKR